MLVCSLSELRHMQRPDQCLRVHLRPTVHRCVSCSWIETCQYIWRVINVLWVISGKHCEIYKDPCLKLRCQNGGRCEGEGRNVSCVCPPGYMGEYYWLLHDISLSFTGSGITYYILLLLFESIRIHRPLNMIILVQGTRILKGSYIFSCIKSQCILWNIYIV